MRDAIPVDAVLDGELVVVAPRPAAEGAPPALDDLREIQPFALLQQRLRRKNLGAKILQKLPVALIAHDILELDGQDIRRRPQSARRSLLEDQVGQARARGSARARDLPLRLSPLLHAPDWRALQTLRETARAFGAEGIC